MSAHKVTSFFISTLLIIGFVTTSHATVITIGALSTNDDGSTEVITDSLNNLEWLRFDILKSLTYAETMAAVNTGGAYEGWTIANNTTAQSFVNALYAPGANACTAGTTSYFCGAITYIDGQFGNSWGSNTDSAFFLSGLGYKPAGLLELYSGQALKFNAFSSFAFADNLSHGSDNDTGWLMYRSVSVPEPASLALMGLGLVGMGFARRKKAA